MPFIKANEIRIYYETHGEGHPLILVSGFSQNHLSWKEFIPPLSKHFQVIVFDNRGSGQTDTPEGGYSITMFAEDVIALMDTLQIENAHFMGESMGTLIIQKLCLSHRDRIKKAVLCAPFSHCPPISMHNMHTQLKMLASGVNRQFLNELNASWLLSNSFIKNPENIKIFLNYIQKNAYPSSLDALLAQANALKIDLRKEIKDIPHEILLLVGEKDISTPLDCAQYMCQEIPNCKMHIFKEMGHAFNYEIPEQSIKHALNFFLQR